MNHSPDAARPRRRERVGDSAAELHKGPPGLFVAGTGTAVGKTQVACLIARTLALQGLRVGVYKSVASGSGDIDSDPDCDAARLWNAAGRPGRLRDVCPQSFAAPLAPHLAARAEGKRIDSELLVAGLPIVAADSDVVLVEGAGGLLSPLDDDLLCADLAAQLGLPLLIVAANELGVLNASLQTLSAARAYCPNLPVVGLVLCEPRADLDDPSRAGNADELARWSAAPILGVLAHGTAELDRPVDWFALARPARPAGYLSGR